ncbi:peptide-methionine (S)-S-oxide reductase MsrA [uncultured Mucilaginibacter sp.]|uniref:peptide-methionine (S)-S-oxide reductase MsrA n=1 Tax=uncultured Mucilaginibacter sp. TaxID=797541 RepID=UPI0025F8342E|nr:peptide-methionine (S)-S-oxide reductase MsrA [uncultured Mucilaginibacter sp.]
MRKIKTVLLALILAIVIQGVSIAQGSKTATEKATFGMGCFWCSEAIFQRLKGVTKVESGYAGGSVKNPTYEAVCSGTTGHAEVVQVTFQPSVISYKELLEIFWKMHDPTTLNKQGADVGTQYRSVIFYHNAQQKALADTYKAELNKQKAFPDPVVTAIEPFKNFFVAENYHQNYFKLNGSQPYCRMVILPKVDKLEKVFKQKLKQ